MRMLEDINDTLGVYEVLSLNATPVWEPHEHLNRSNPDYFIVTVCYSPANGEDRIGEYILDGTSETYAKAVADFNRVCTQAAERGFFRLTDFQGFEVD